MWLFFFFIKLLLVIQFLDFLFFFVEKVQYENNLSCYLFMLFFFYMIITDAFIRKFSYYLDLDFIFWSL